MRLPKPAPHEDPSRPPRPMEVINALAVTRGWTAGSGLPGEEKRSALLMLFGLQLNSCGSELWRLRRLPCACPNVRGWGEGGGREGEMFQYGEAGGAQLCEIQLTVSQATPPVGLSCS